MSFSLRIESLLMLMIARCEAGAEFQPDGCDGYCAGDDSSLD